MGTLAELYINSVPVLLLTLTLSSFAVKTWGLSEPPDISHCLLALALTDPPAYPPPPTDIGTLLRFVFSIPLQALSDTRSGEGRMDKDRDFVAEATTMARLWAECEKEGLPASMPL